MIVGMRYGKTLLMKNLIADYERETGKKVVPFDPKARNQTVMLAANGTSYDASRVLFVPDTRLAGGA